MLSLLPLHQGLMAVLWLAVVLLLILGVSRAARFVPVHWRLANLHGAQVPTDSPRLRGSLALDVRRRLHLVEVAGQSMLILTGGAADIMIALQEPPK